ncbi:MAG: hypothetical protein Pg6C_16960 [Treponemataceae bacterium]|nr:MAG: hypothetical protein Pg6C_16960 [Treponemataceae bacterium]
MERLEGLDRQNDLYLQMGKFAKSFTTDKDGNFIFDVEASNENLDLEGERTLQRALLGTKEYFLTNGVISKDHLHQEVRPKEKGGGIQYHEQYVIGEPLEVYTEGNSTRVRGKLYKSNPYAQEFMKLLRDGSTRVKASVGGLIPQKVKNKDGTKTVTSVLWNDLALTIAPVNPTVAPAAAITKAMTSAEFVKSLSAGYGTDSGTFSGGRALQKEEAGHETVTVTNEEAIASLVGAIGDGGVKDLEDAVKFLNGYGYSDTSAKAIIAAVVKNHKELLEVLPMAKNLWEAATERLRKALGSPGEGEDDPDEGGQGTEGGEGQDEGNDDDVQDATPVLKALSEHIEKLEAANETIAKALTGLMEQSEQTAALQKSIGESLMLVMQGQQALATTPQPRKSAVSALEAAMLAKAGLGGLAQNGLAAASGATRLKGFTQADLDEAKDILSKAMKDGKLTLMEVTRAESQLNKCLNNPAATIDAKFANILRGGAQ